MISSVLMPATSRPVAVLRSRRTSRCPLLSAPSARTTCRRATNLDDLDLIPGVQPVLGPQMRRDGHLPFAVQHHDGLPQTQVAMYYSYYVIVTHGTPRALVTAQEPPSTISNVFGTCRERRRERRGVTWVTALILMALALPALLARLAGGYPPNPGPELAALVPVAVVPAVAAVIIAACAAWWLAALLAIPAVLLVVWQLPPLRRVRFQAASRPSSGTGSAATTLRLRLFTLNAKGGGADSAVILRILQQYEVDVLAVQELTPPMVTRLAAAGLTRVLHFLILTSGQVGQAPACGRAGR